MAYIDQERVLQELTEACDELDVRFLKSRTVRETIEVVATAPCGEQAEYPSVTTAAEQTGGQKSRISAACRTGIPYRGISWRYADEEGSVW